jgi:hypothetical protein
VGPLYIEEIKKHPEAVRGAPNDILRSALFAAIQGKGRQHLENRLIASVESISIKYTGEQLDQSDLDVWEQVIHLARQTQLGTVCEFKGGTFLKALGRSTGKKDYQWLDRVLSRLTACEVRFMCPGYTYGCGLIASYDIDEHTRIYRVYVDSGFESFPFHYPKVFIPGYASAYRKTSLAILPKEESFDAFYPSYLTECFKSCFVGIEAAIPQFYKDFRPLERLPLERLFYDTELDLDPLSLYNYRENSATPISLLRKGVIKPKEGEPQHRVDTAKPQALKELEDSVEEKLKSSEDTSDIFNIPVSVAVSLAPDINKASQKGVSHEEIKQALQQKAQALQKKGEIFSRPPKPAEAKQTPAFSEIARWKSKEKSGPASKYLQDNYGHLLKRYNRELDRDLICLQDIKAHDKTLWRGLYSEAKKTGIKPSEYVASKSQRTKEAALDTDIGKLREFEREAARQRQAMRRHGISLESLKNKP